MLVGYARVSTVEQNLDRQLVAFEENNVEKVFQDKASGKNTDRPQLQAMLDFVREGDTVIVTELARLGRDTKDLLTIIDQLQAKGVEFRSLKDNIDTNTPTGRLMLTMLSAIGQFERECILERQREGIAIAKEQGKYKGRQAKELPQFEELYGKYLAREIPSKTELAKLLGISRVTLDRRIKEYESCSGNK